ncbi:Rid family hydrolase [Bradyrhizobium sp. AZCC 2230]|uniref:Rid family hydrolase n=1 Tax=Bradyrhizobium sp. AZCC 2230 TaxID=3117021 RepID=UPI002FF1E9B8
MTTHNMITPIAADLVPAVATPCFVVMEDRVLHNLRVTAQACGGVERLMPHVKTHRAAWLVALLLANGVDAFKASTLTEVEMVLAAGATRVTWAFPTVNPQNIGRFVELATIFPKAELTGLVDSRKGLEVWTRLLDGAPPSINLRIDLDPEMGRTGVPMNQTALELARAVARLGRLAGWHLYDGHIRGAYDERKVEVQKLADTLETLQSGLRGDGIDVDAIGACSYTFDLWPRSVMRHVSPGTWVYSNAEHLRELAHHNWVAAGFVLTTVVSTRNGTATLDAGSKAISPDKPQRQRFQGVGDIVLMNEEHTVIRCDTLDTGDRLLLVPEHTCTTAYLYNHALVRSIDGQWGYRDQLGNERSIVALTGRPPVGGRIPTSVGVSLQPETPQLAESSKHPSTGGHYSLWRKAGGMIYVAGQVPRDRERNILGDSIEEQTTAVLNNLRLVLEDAGTDFSRLVRVQAYLSDISEFQRFNAVYAKVMGLAAPVRTTIGCALNGVRVEVDAVAEAGDVTGGA